jgi:hypothetical protein
MLCIYEKKKEMKQKERYETKRDEIYNLYRYAQTKFNLKLNCATQIFSILRAI